MGTEVKDITEEIPFDLPDSWGIVRLSCVCWLEDGTKTINERLPNLDAKTLRGKTLETFLNLGKVVEKNQKVILVDGENSGEVFIVPFRGYLGSTFKVLGISPLLNAAYVNAILKLYKDLFRGNKIGAAIPHLNKTIFKSLIVSIPPLTEQARIVEAIKKYEPLIAEYDKLEKEATALDDTIKDKLKKSILQYAYKAN